MSIHCYLQHALAALVLLAVFVGSATAQNTRISSTPTLQTRQTTSTGRPQISPTADFSEEVANAVLNDIRNGLEGHNQRRVLSAFDAEKMDGYLSFEDQIQSYLEFYESFRVYFRIIQTSTDGLKGIVLAEFQIEGTPRSGGNAVRRSNQLRFELERGKEGWKIVDFRPRRFFS
ncbi:MAG TPA: hypothetical protein VN622_03095 [Clostridia bacterium]|nr:hypothetical protein [Clostridia bacterium]